MQSLRMLLQAQLDHTLCSPLVLTLETAGASGPASSLTFDGGHLAVVDSQGACKLQSSFDFQPDQLQLCIISTHFSHACNYAIRPRWRFRCLRLQTDLWTIFVGF